MLPSKFNFRTRFCWRLYTCTVDGDSAHIRWEGKAEGVPYKTSDVERYVEEGSWMIEEIPQPLLEVGMRVKLRNGYTYIVSGVDTDGFTYVTRPEMFGGDDISSINLSTSWDREDSVEIVAVWERPTNYSSYLHPSDVGELLWEIREECEKVIKIRRVKEEIRELEERLKELEGD